MDNSGVVPQQSKNSPNRAAVLHKLPQLHESSGRPQLLMRIKRPIHGQKWNLQKVGFAMLCQNPRPKRVTSAGAKSDAVGKTHRGIVREAQSFPLDPQLRVPAQKILTAAKLALAKQFLERRNFSR